MLTPENATVCIIFYILIASIIDLYLYYRGLSFFRSSDDTGILWGGYWHQARKYAMGIKRDKLKAIWRRNTMLILSLHLFLISDFVLLAYGYVALFVFLMGALYPLISIFVSFYTIEVLRREYLLEKGDLEEMVVEENLDFKWEGL